MLGAPAADHRLLETLGHTPGTGFTHLPEHLARLADSAACFGYPCDRADADDVVLVNDRGEVTETTIGTLCVRAAGSWWTPPTAVGCLPGTARARLLAEGVLREAVLTTADLHAAEQLAVVNSLRGWRPAVLVRCGSVRRHQVSDR